MNQIVTAIQHMPAWATTAVFAVAGLAAFVIGSRLAHRINAVKLTVAAAVTIGIGTSIEGMYALATGPLHLNGVWIYIPAVLFESAAIATGARAQQYAATNGHPGRYGNTVWAFAVTAGIVTALNGHSPAECAFRLAAPLVGTAVWYQGLTDGGTRPDKTTWLLTPRRLLLWVGAIAPGEHDSFQITRDRRVQRMTRHRVGVERDGRLRAWHDRRLNHLIVGADQELIGEVQRRVTWAKHAVALTAPLPLPAQEVTPEPSATPVPELPVERPGGTSAGTTTGTRTRKVTGTSKRKPAELRLRRPAEETRKLALQIMAELPDLTQADVAQRMGITDRRLRTVLSESTETEPAINGHPTPHLIGVTQ